MTRISQTLRAHIRQNLVGYIALFLALSLGTAWAATELRKNEVKSKHIQNFGVKAKDLAKNSVNSSKVRDGSLLPTDFGGQLPAGPQGEQGVAGPPGLSGWEMTFGSSGPADSTSAKNAIAYCPAGKSVLGGGALIDGGFTGSPPNHQTEVAITWIAPSDALGGVVATAIETEPGTAANWSLEARAICANVG